MNHLFLEEYMLCSAVKMSWLDECSSSNRVFSFLPLQSCHSRIQELFSDKIYLIGIAALVVAVIMVRAQNKQQTPSAKKQL